MPTDTVLSDEQRSDAYIDGTNAGRDHEGGLRQVERAVVSALAARSGVDVKAFARTAASGSHGRDDFDAEMSVIAGALRLALATVEARHAQTPTDAELRDQVQTMNEREAWWRELWKLIDQPAVATDGYASADDYAADSRRHNELRKRLGLDE